MAISADLFSMHLVAQLQVNFSTGFGLEYCLFPCLHVKWYLLAVFFLLFLHAVCHLSVLAFSFTNVS